MGDELLHGLPRTYSLALRLRAIGADEGLIGECLELEASAIPALLALADAKLRSAVEAQGRAVPDHGAGPPAGGPIYHAGA